ncbi:hypothetical protein VE25_15840 [Devosia geojensis]|uniref:DUF2306 domain-containing protein n=2 Tax=Devosia geojensis TaxID=443610 RepID=A0A0F5FPM7_9HYPH|nr:hypothetical protein VE25_15840 [Devosia geojensis]
MDPGPLLTSPVTIQIHALAAMSALFVGLVLLFRRKGDAPHRLLGRMWVTLMTVLAITAFFIYEIRLLGPFSPLHLLAILTLYTLLRGVWFIRHGEVGKHKAAMRTLFFAALIGAGIFTLLPGRVLNETLTGGAGGWLPFAIAVALALAIAAAYFRNRRKIDGI